MNKINLIVQENLILEKGDPLGAIIASCVDSETAYDILRKLQEHELLSEILKKQKQATINFVDWLTKKDSPYAVMYGETPKRLSTLEEDFTIEEIYDKYCKEIYGDKF